MARDRQAAYNRAAITVSKKGISPETFKDRTFYKRINLKGQGGIVELMRDQVVKLVGESNFDGNTLDAGRHIIIDSVRVLGDGTAAAIGKAKWETLLPPALLNAELEIEQGGTVFSMPISDLHKKGGTFVNDDDFREVASPVVLYPMRQFEIKVKFPKGESMAADADFWVNIEFRSFEAFAK